MLDAANPCTHALFEFNCLVLYPPMPSHNASHIKQQDKRTSDFIRGADAKAIPHTSSHRIAIAVEAVRRRRRVTRLETRRGPVCCQLGSPRIGHRVSRGYSRPPSVVTHRPSPVSPPDTASSAGSFTGTPCHNGLPGMDTTYMVTTRHPLK